MQSQEKATELLSKLIEKEKAEAELSKLNKEITSECMQLAESMQTEGVDKVSINGIEFKPTQDISFSLVGGGQWDDNPVFFEWLKTEGLGDLIKTRETVHWATRNKVLKDRMDEGQAVPEFIEVKFFDTVKFNKAAIGRLAAVAREVG